MQIVCAIRYHFVVLLVLAGLMGNVVNASEFLCEGVETPVVDVNCTEGAGCPHHVPQPRNGSSPVCTCVKTVQAAPRQNTTRARLRNAEVVAIQTVAPIQTATMPAVVIHSPIPTSPHVLVRTIILQT